MAARAARRAWTDHLLLHWCQQSAPGEEDVAVPTPLVLAPALAGEFARLAVTLDRLLRRFSDALLAGTDTTRGFKPPEFPLAKEILAAGPLRAPFFWSRFDVFERAGGGLAVLEYNCDKPAGQREIWAGEEQEPRRANPNRGARASFGRALARALARHVGGVERRSGAARLRRRLAILVDPAHREEFRLAYLFGRMAGALGWEWEVVGPDNLAVEDGRAVAYGEPVDVILRQYPTEFLHELPAAGPLWNASLEGRLLWLNDPRAVLTQAKSLFAHLWELVHQRRLLTRGEVAAVTRYIPATGLAASPGWLDRAAARPEDWVIKPVLGRYSERVVLGALAASDAWQQALAMAAAHPDDYIIQAYVPPRRHWLPSARAGRAGHVNWGVYLAGGRFAGLCPRLQPTALTEEGASWWTPLRLGRVLAEQPTVLIPRRGIAPTRRRRVAGGRAESWRGPGRTWQAVADRHSLAGYTNVWTDGLANFTLAAVGLTRAMWDELCHASLVLCGAVGRVLTHLEGHPELLGPLGIPPALASLVTRARGAEPWSFLSRFDWARTRDGRWKLMEINSDTPAGLWEAGPVGTDIARLHPAACSLGVDLEAALAESWRRCCARRLGAAVVDERLTVGLIGVLGAPEDRDQLRAHARAAQSALPRAGFVLGAPEQVEARAGRAWLHGRPLDLLFRYYPLDWLADARFEPLLDLLTAGGLPILPPAHALIPQSKAFLALLWELVERGFFPPAEAAGIRDHVPFTALDARRFRHARYVIKPYLEREGLGVRFASGLTARERRRLSGSDVVYQDELDLVKVRLPVATAQGWAAEERFIVFGVYVAGAEIAGVYTRAGARVTGREAVFVPALLRP